MKKRKLLLIAIASLAIAGCTTAQKGDCALKVVEYVRAYASAEVENYEDIPSLPEYRSIYLAHCENDLFIEVPDDCIQSFLDIKRTGRKIYYAVETIPWWVSNKGWEMK